MRSVDGSKFALKLFWQNVVLGSEVDDVKYTFLGAEEPPEFEVIQMKPPRIAETQDPLHVQRDQYSDDEVGDETASWANDSQTSRSAYRHTRSSSSERTVREIHSPQGSTHSDATLNESPTSFIKPRVPLIQRITQGAFATLERALVFAGFGLTLSGIVVYTGGCREGYINGCLAHLISRQDSYCVEHWH